MYGAVNNDPVGSPPKMPGGKGRVRRVFALLAALGCVGAVALPGGRLAVTNDASEDLSFRGNASVTVLDDELEDEDENKGYTYGPSGSHGTLKKWELALIIVGAIAGGTLLLLCASYYAPCLQPDP